MLRHSRAMTRFQRARKIAKRKNLLNALWRNGWTEDDGQLSKHSWHHNKCYDCNPRYNRAREKRGLHQYHGSVPWFFR